MKGVTLLFHFNSCTAFELQNKDLIFIDWKVKKFNKDIPYLHYPKYDVSISLFPASGGPQIEQRELTVYAAANIKKVGIKQLVLEYLKLKEGNYITSITIQDHGTE